MSVINNVIDELLNADDFLAIFFSLLQAIH